MRLLSVRSDHVGISPAGRQPASDGCRHRRRDGRKYLPLRHLSADSRCHQAGSRVRLQAGRARMIIDRLLTAMAADDDAGKHDLSRRTLLKAGLASGGGLLLSMRMPMLAAHAAASPADFVPNAFVRIAPSGQVTLTMPYVEMGQGTYTSIPMLIAEELEVELGEITLEHAPPDEKRYGNPILGGVQATGGSTTIRAVWLPLRQAGAAARTMLVMVAAKQWGVDPSSCRAEKGAVLHPASRRRLDYGALAEAAAALPVPNNVPLKRPDQFRLIG